MVHLLAAAYGAAKAAGASLVLIKGEGRPFCAGGDGAQSQARTPSSVAPPPSNGPLGLAQWRH
eukprot:SAG11_NODE_22317_length_408_cov_0.841424_1_plen_63_part_00